MMMKHTLFYTIVFACAVSLGFTSCDRFLDKKMLKSLTVPATVDDLDALLSATGKINNSVMPALLEMGADNYVLQESAYNNLTVFERNNYTWASDVEYQLVNVSSEWSKTYEIVLIANTVLEYLPKVAGTAAEKDRLRGEALFLRAWCFYQLAQVYGPVYRPGQNNQDWAIPLRTQSDLNASNPRATVGETYDFIVAALEEANTLLPAISTHVTRPDRTAGLALLARVYLSMSDYRNAGRIADEALKTKNTLLDYNAIRVDDRLPFERFNEETLYFATNAFIQILNPTISFVHPALIAMYEDGDLRKRAFFAPAQDSYFTFKGSYTGTISGSHFVGLTTAELYLTLAESLVREQEVARGIQALNTLLEKRWDQDLFVPLAVTNQEEALVHILNERRKELIFRGVRWTDIRRLNLDSRFAITLDRTIGGQTFTLPPHDPRFVYLIPQDVIRLSGIPQNPR